MLRVSALSKSHDAEPLFERVDFTLNPGDRVGLVGPNGAGKSTLLRVLTGEEPPSSGHVALAPGRRIGFFAQQVPDPEATVGAFLREGLGEVDRLATRMRELEPALARGEALAEYGEVQDRWLALAGWSAANRLAEVRHRLDIAHLPDDSTLIEVSGGEQARLMLARVLLAEPDVLLLDEPTNHLDAAGTGWLGDFLGGFRGAVVVVSHDRAFLDRTVTRIVELDGIHTDPQWYEGGYTAYRDEKQRRWQRLLLDYEAQEKQRRRLADDIARTKEHALHTELSTRNDKLRRYAKKVAKKAKVRERRLARQMASTRWIAEPEARPALTLAFPADGHRDETVLRATGLSIKIGGRVHFEGVDLDVRAGDRIRVVGPNGAGKTTLLRSLAGLRQPDGGSVEAVGAVTMLPQTHDELLLGRRGRVSVLDYFRSHVPVYVDEAEKLLEAHLFGPDEWDSRIDTLSAGEFRRLLLAVLVNSTARILFFGRTDSLPGFRGARCRRRRDQGFSGNVDRRHT